MTTVLPILPTKLGWEPSPNSSSRYGHPVELVVVHRWGVHVTTPAGEALTYQGVVNYLREPSSQVSAHIVFPGSAVPDTAAQLVAWADMAWAEAAYNPVADEVESADELWIDAAPKPDSVGLAVLARIVAFRLHERGLPPVWSTSRGFCRHADLGAAGGGHTECPTVDLAYWKTFCRMVTAEVLRGGFRPVWGR
jgi:hypothetical protein